PIIDMRHYRSIVLADDYLDLPQWPSVFALDRDQREPRIFTSLLYMPIMSSAGGHMPTKRLARDRPDSSNASEAAMAPKALNRKKCDGSFADCCSMRRVRTSSDSSSRCTGDGTYSPSDLSLAGFTS